MINVTVSLPGHGRYSGGAYPLENRTFRDEKKARSFYSDMLVKYSNANVEFVKL